MPLASNAFSPRVRPLRIGYLSLTDAAPLIAAQELGYFAKEGLEVELRRDVGWATIRDKIIYGELDAAQCPAPVLWSMALGIGCTACDALTAFVLNENGTALTLSARLWAAGVRDAASLREHVKRLSRKSPLVFGTVFPFSSHNILLREWLQSGGLKPDDDVRIVVVPPAQMFRNLVAGTIDGFCAGEPWNSVAVSEGAGWCPTWGAAHQKGQPEKVLAVTARFAEERTEQHAGLVRALARSAQWCDEPQNRQPLGEMLAGPTYLNLPAKVITPALCGRFNCGNDRIESIPDFHIFHRGGANMPTTEKAVALQRALGGANLISTAQAADPDLPGRLFRADLHRDILDFDRPAEALSGLAQLTPQHAG